MNLLLGMFSFNIPNVIWCRCGRLRKTIQLWQSSRFDAYHSIALFVHGHLTYYETSSVIWCLSENQSSVVRTVSVPWIWHLAVWQSIHCNYETCPIVNQTLCTNDFHRSLSCIDAQYLLSVCPLYKMHIAQCTLHIGTMSSGALDIAYHYP